MESNPTLAGKAAPLLGAKLIMAVVNESGILSGHSWGAVF